MRTQSFALLVSLTLLVTGLFAVLPARPVQAQACDPATGGCPTAKPRNKKKPTLPPPPRWTPTPTCLDAEGTKVACPTRTATITPPCLDAITGHIVACVPPPCFDVYDYKECTKTPTAATPTCMNPLNYKVEDYKSDNVACPTPTPAASAVPAAGGGNPPSGQGPFGMIIAGLLIGLLFTGAIIVVARNNLKGGFADGTVKPPRPGNLGGGGAADQFQKADGPSNQFQKADSPSNQFQKADGPSSQFQKADNPPDQFIKGNGPEA